MPLFDNADFESTIEDLGTHDFEVKFKDATVKATLQLLSESGAETRVVVSTAPSPRLRAVTLARTGPRGRSPSRPTSAPTGPARRRPVVGAIGARKPRAAGEAPPA